MGNIRPVVFLNNLFFLLHVNKYAYICSRNTNF